MTPSCTFIPLVVDSSFSVPSLTRVFPLFSFTLLVVFSFCFPKFIFMISSGTFIPTVVGSIFCSVNLPLMFPPEFLLCCFKNFIISSSFFVPWPLISLTLLQ
uniref:Uncharacterized protein n=1 Tax=Cacopsylla melanoneura TaxID=428564 RepID=A0A8D9F6W2_9HEMI